MNQLPCIDIWVARLLMVSFFLPMHVQVFVAIACCLYFVGRTWLQRIVHPARYYFIAALFGGFLLLYLGAALFTPAEYIPALLHQCENRLALLLIPMVFAIMSPQYTDVVRGQLRYFIYACVLSCIIGNAGFAYDHMHNPAQPLSHVFYRLSFESYTGVHPTYMSVYLCLGIYVLMLEPGIPAWQRTVLGYLSVVLLLALLAKSPILALGIIVLHFLYRRLAALRQYGVHVAAVLGVVAAAYLFIPFVRQRVAELVSPKAQQQTVVDNSMNMRKLIWDVDTRLLHHYWLTGAGPGRLKHLLDEQYFVYSLSHGIYPGYYDPHNEYFAEWLALGLVGIALLLVILTVHFATAIRRKDSLYLYTMLTLAITFATETMLARQRGIMFFAVFTAMFFYGHYSRSKETLQ